jgi:type II secretory pathway component PulJ
MRLRSHLVALVLAALVPVLGFAALVMRENARLQKPDALLAAIHAAVPGDP